MLREQGGGVEYNENNFKKKNQLRNNSNKSIEINQKNKPWSKSTSTIRILQLIIDASIYQFTL